jgi:NAD+ kinase
MRVAIFGSSFQSEKINQVWSVFDTLHHLEAEVLVGREFYEFLRSTLINLPAVSGIIEENEDFNTDFALSIGGDGTYLRTAHRIGRREIPILGINTGRLGFLADVDTIEIESVITDLYKNNFKTVDYSLLSLAINGEKLESFCALNEIAVLKKGSSSMINIHAWVNGEYLNGYQADGLIIATPTGSTAYALSVGGPIIMPSCRNLLIAPVAPHNLAARPLVLDDSSVIDLEVESRSQTFLVAIDGISKPVSADDKLQIVRADFVVKAIKRPENSFIYTLRKKLMWGMDPRG